MDNITRHIVREAMRMVSKDVRLPKVVRYGKVKRIKTKKMDKK